VKFYCAHDWSNWCDPQTVQQFPDYGWKSIFRMRLCVSCGKLDFKQIRADYLPKAEGKE